MQISQDSDAEKKEEESETRKGPEIASGNLTCQVTIQSANSDSTLKSSTISMPLNKALEVDSVKGAENLS